MELTDLYASIRNDKFPNIKQFVMKMLVLSVSTYICEQTFSCMNINKSIGLGTLIQSLILYYGFQPVP